MLHKMVVVKLSPLELLIEINDTNQDLSRCAVYGDNIDQANLDNWQRFAKPETSLSHWYT